MNEPRLLSNGSNLKDKITNKNLEETKVILTSSFEG